MPSTTFDPSHVTDARRAGLSDSRILDNLDHHAADLGRSLEEYVTHGNTAWDRELSWIVEDAEALRVYRRQLLDYLLGNPGVLP